MTYLRQKTWRHKGKLPNTYTEGKVQQGTYNPRTAEEHRGSAPRPAQRLADRRARRRTL